jgi:hypothetical protein
MIELLILLIVSSSGTITVQEVGYLEVTDCYYVAKYINHNTDKSVHAICTDTTIH